MLIPMQHISVLRIFELHMQITRDGTIHLPPDSILPRYLGADTICIAIFLRILIL